MRAGGIGTLVAALLISLPLATSAQDQQPPREERVLEFEPDTGCPDEPCGCNQSGPVDLLQYFIPTYSGWQTAKQVWLYLGGGTTYYRFFQYGSNKFEMIKCMEGTCVAGHTAGPGGVFVTSEFGPGILGSDSRIFLGSGLFWFPAVICPNMRPFRMCHQGERLINPTSCLPLRDTRPHCATYLSRVDFAPAWNYGYEVGVVDSIIKVDKLDNGEIEKYWYGRGIGLLRYERWTAQGQLVTWGQKTRDIPNSPIQHNACPLP